MMCKNPLRRGVAEFGCGRCTPCRINRRRLWQFRLVLEATQHELSIFATFTYNKDNTPPNGSVSKREMQLLMKRIRHVCSPAIIRFYGVGEYGDDTFRPHYHIALFGIPFSLIAGHIPVSEVYAFNKVCQCALCREWNKGAVDVGEINADSCGYISGYVVKKMTSDDDVRLQGRQAEFALMSRRPGIGALSLPQIVQVLTSKYGSLAVCRAGGVPVALKFAGKEWPLGRYLRGKLAEHVGIVKQKYLRGEEPLDVGLLQRQYELLAPGGKALREARRDSQSRKAEFWLKIRNGGKSL